MRARKRLFCLLIHDLFVQNFFPYCMGLCFTPGESCKYLGILLEQHTFKVREFFIVLNSKLHIPWRPSPLPPTLNYEIVTPPRKTALDTFSNHHRTGQDQLMFKCYPLSKRHRRLKISSN